jgi:hypothetical protein
MPRTPARSSEKHIADYLAAELIGDRYDEWKELFVPEFLARSSVLDRNICVVTGLRGCGKTMIFRRLTALFDCHLGPSDVPRANTFIGCYLNARTIAEAFPWLPETEEENARQQILHYFHVSWSLEIIDWLGMEAGARALNFDWLYNFFSRALGVNILAGAPQEVAALRAYLEEEQQRAKLHSGYAPQRWKLADLTFLESLVREISRNCEWIEEKPFYFFLDDYSTPLITPQTQRILNAVVFRRCATAIFKIATESAESFLPVGLNGKILQEKDDYVLIDFGTQALMSSSAQNKSILSAILTRRINRNECLRNRELDMGIILGKTPYSNNALGLLLRGEDEKRKKAVYHGTNCFCSMWSSDIREMIGTFANMVSLEDDAVLRAEPKGRLISAEVQDKAMREAGSRYLSLLGAATNPSERMFEIGEQDKSYGDHLMKIARAFQEIAVYELKVRNSKNEEGNPPKQARRIEIIEVGHDLPEPLVDYYRGIIRYGLFTRDTRGKSVRGKVVPRLYLRGLLIPYFTMTFSKRDSITMKWTEFCDFLSDPVHFAAVWTKKKPGYDSPTLPGMNV